MSSPSREDTQSADPPAKRERRRSRRFQTEARCWITSSRSALYTQLRNISRGGLSIPDPAPFKAGEEVSVRILGADRSKDLLARLRVVWCSADPDDPGGMGGEFVEIAAGEQLLDQMLADAANGNHVETDAALPKPAK